MRAITLWLGATCLAALAAGCAFDVGLDGQGGVAFSCTSDDDCVEGYFCAPSDREEGALGRCVEAEGIDGNCFDDDGDGFSAGSDCEAGVQQDCNDDDPTIFPGQDESCNGVDDDCDEEVDEDVGPRSCPKTVGICAGSQVECVDGAYPDCEAGVGYPDDYQEVETSCDGVDNNCDGLVDEGCCDDEVYEDGCNCVPGQRWPCGTDTGVCTRGIRVCLPDGTVSECIEADLGEDCTFDTEADDFGDSACGEGGRCVREDYTNLEDFFDDCESGRCTRDVCRYLDDDASCSADDDCGMDEVCVDGACQMLNVRPLTGEGGEIVEVCNGLDDNCNGQIDDDGDRLNICGLCPYNMVRISIQTSSPAQEPFICVDMYEASMPDATADDMGMFDYYATAQPGVMPWTGIDSADAEAACLAEPYLDLLGPGAIRPLPTKRLCRTFEYEQACGGKFGTASESDYPYGTQMMNDYQEGLCNVTGMGVEPTGSFDECSREGLESPIRGVLSSYDMVGNVAEWIEGPTGPVLAGGYYGGDPISGMAADATCGNHAPVGSLGFDDGEYPDWVGFRCCTLVAR